MSELGPAKAAADILATILTTIRDARRLKAECSEIEVIARTCLQILEKRQPVMLDSKVSGDFQTYLTKLLKLVAECRDSSIFQRAWEVAWRHRLANLKQQFVTWLALLSAETTLASRDDLLKQIESARGDDVRSEEHLHTIISKLQILDDIKKNQENKRAGELVVDFEESDERLKVETSESADILQGTLEGPDGAVVPVTCDAVQEQLMRFGEKGPRHVLIYSRLSENTRVHPFYGIARRNGKRWTVFKDMTSCDTLSAAILHGKLPEPFSERLAIAREIALTVDYLHSVDILVKRLSDKHILLEEQHGRLIPYITNIESARMFKETSTGAGAYDARYEASELSRTVGSRHNIYTDIWSLGILIWQCIASAVPFGFESEVTKGAERDRILESIREGIMPWDKTESAGSNIPYHSSIMKQTISLCQACCSPVANSRPSAAEVANKLSDLVISADMSIEPNQSLSEDFQSRVRTTIQAAARSGSGEKPHITPDEVQLLRASADNGDFTAAYLLGVAIWHQAAEPVATGSQDDISFVLVAGVDPSIELRCRRSIAYLERGLQGGEKKASQWLAQAHSKLSQLYGQQTEQNKNFGVL
ncbi:kinase-like domain-containing protein [Xylaria sp. FL0933]|nr:kinase-like domain-containing protein [Xylaria sp. FL0933]